MCVFQGNLSIFVQIHVVMQTIEIRNIGPLVDTGVVPLSQVMLLIGEQSTGKSTFMKILCFCCWIEKQVMMGGEHVLYKYTHYYRFWSELKKFHRLNDDFLKDNSFVRYDGLAVQIELRNKKSNAKIVRKPHFSTIKHPLKISFLPSERNLLSSIQNIESLYRSKEVDVLFNYILEWNDARPYFSSSHPLDLVFVEKMKYHYDVKLGDVLTLADGCSKIKPYYASSGVQSALPIQVLATWMAEEVGTPVKISPAEYLKQMDATRPEDWSNLLDEFKSLQGRMRYRSFHLFIEELEQNLFPKAQFELVKLLMALLKKAEQKETEYRSTVFLTTHSPYVLTALNVMMLASVAYELDPIKVSGLGLQDYILPKDCFSAYLIQNGRLENLMDEEDHFIKGEYLDAISEEVDQYTYHLNTIIYGNAEG